MNGEVLIVDDTPGNLQVLGSILQRAGLTVRLAPDGAFALRSVAARRPDLILLDVRMPDMDGLEVCRQLRRDPATSGIPVLFLSASDEIAERLGAFAAGGLDFISKPFQADEVLARVSTHLSLARLREQLASANSHLAERVVDERDHRRRAEDLAHERQARLELVMAAAGMGTWTIAGEDGAAELDAEAMAILGTRDARLPGGWSGLAAGFSDEERPAIAAAWARGQGGSGVFEVEGWWHAGGPRRRLRLRGRALSGQGTAPRVIGLVWDVTGSHNLALRLVQSEKLESLGQLAGGLAHDFNNHLMVILGNIDLLRTSMADEAKVGERLTSIDRAAMNASSLVRDLLTFSRRREIRLERIQLASVVIELEALLRSMLGKRIELTLGRVDAGLAVLGSREQLQNALLNLCVNARDAMPDGGRLSLSVQAEDVAGAQCRICAHEVSGSFASITVSDDGSGIPEAIQDRIFEPFFTTKPEGKGTGLGLATVVGCVTAHHGHLLMESEPEIGTRFRILIPPAAADMLETVHA
jgi:signal transduction histidine kinase